MPSPTSSRIDQIRKTYPHTTIAVGFAGKTTDMKEKHIPIAVDSIPNERNPNSQCPYPINESISPIAPPSYESTINPEKD